MIEMTKSELLYCKCNLERENRHLKEQVRELQNQLNLKDMDVKQLKNQLFIQRPSPELEHTRQAVQMVMMSFPKAKGA